MKAWARVVSGLEWLIAHPALADALQKSGDLYFPTPKLEVDSWRNLLEGVKTAHIFEFDDDTARLMELSDTEPHEIRLPFPLVFLDCTFAVNQAKIRNRYAGIFLYQYDQMQPPDELRVRTEGSMTIPNAITADLHMNLSSKQIMERLPDKLRMENHVTACAFITEPGKPWITNVFYPIDKDPREMYGVALGLNARAIKMGRYGQREWAAMRNIALNFLDLLNTPDVYIVPIRRGKKNIERRKREGKPALPPSDIVYLRPSIRRYVDDLKASGEWNVSHRFWVRGHFRHYRSERYHYILSHDADRVMNDGGEIRVGTCPTCFGIEFIKPFIKGRGLLIKKRYRKAKA